MNWSENWFELNELVGNRFGLEGLVENWFEWIELGGKDKVGLGELVGKLV